MQAVVDRTVANEAAGLFNESTGEEDDPIVRLDLMSQPKQYHLRMNSGSPAVFYQDVCTICMNRFAATDHCCRLHAGMFSTASASVSIWLTMNRWRSETSGCSVRTAEKSRVE